MSAGRRKGKGQGAESRSDLDDAVGRADAGVGGDRTTEVRVDEEILAEALGRPDPVAGGELPERPPAQGDRRCGPPGGWLATR